MALTLIPSNYVMYLHATFPPIITSIYHKYVVLTIMLVLSGGPEGFTALHHSVHMHAPQALHFLLSSLSESQLDRQATDKQGRTYEELAHELGYSSMLKEV